MRLTPLLLLLYLPWAHAGGNLDFEVAPQDEGAGEAYTWREAVAACEEKGMVLPSLEDAAAMFCHARLDEKKVEQGYPQSDEGCRGSGTSASLPNFKTGRYWTASQYNDGVVRFIDFLDGQIGYTGKAEKLNVRCILPDDPGRAAGARVFPYDINDVDERGFHYVVDTIESIYRDVFEAVGKELVIRKMWEEEDENATSLYIEENDREADRVRQLREIELVGGLARHPMLDRDAYAMIVCHEIGHHLGGAPYALGYSAEGQSDYFASSKCMKRFLEVADYEQGAWEPVPRELKEQCAASYAGTTERAICERNILAGLKLSRWIAFSREVEPTELSRRDPSRVRKTLVHGYPKPQCRLDTLVAGALCPVDERAMFSVDDPKAGACNRDDGYVLEARPQCWYQGEDKG